MVDHEDRDGREGGALIPSLAPPTVGSDGTAFVASNDRAAVVYAVDPSADARRPGWPYRAGSALVWTEPPPDVTGSGSSRVEPAVGPDGTLYLPLAGSSGRGGSLVAIAPDGRVRAGWPVALTRSDAAFWSVDVGSDGTVHALAVEPEAGDRRSGTMLALDPSGTVRYRQPIIEP